MENKDWFSKGKNTENNNIAQKAFEKNTAWIFIFCPKYINILWPSPQQFKPIKKENF